VRQRSKFQLAEGTLPRGLTCHCTHKAVCLPVPATQLPSYLSPAAKAPPPPPPFLSSVLPAFSLFLRSRLHACRRASAITRRSTPRFCAAGAGRSAPSLRGLTCHSADKAVNIKFVPLYICRAERERERETSREGKGGERYITARTHSHCI
jgi:hypothetical protein